MSQTAAIAGGETRTRHLGRGHIVALDGVRGCAVLAVMATHLLTGNTTRLPRPVSSLLELGVAGVDVFFVLSGFLITGILLDSMGDSRYFRKFYARRMLRIFPLYYGVVLLLICLTVPLGIHWAGRQWSLLLYLQNTQSLFPSFLTFYNPNFSIDHLWSLAVEEQFYLVWPLLIALLRSGRRVIVVCALGVALSFWLRVHCLQAGYDFNWVNRNTLCRSDELLAGAALAAVLRSSLAGHAVRAGRLIVAFAGAAILGQALLLPDTTAGIDLLHPYLISAHYEWNLCFAVGLILCCVRPASRLRRVFEWKHLRSFGKYSYGLYVLHFTLLSAATSLLLQPLRDVLGSKVAARLFVAALVFSVSCVAAYVSFHAYEKRFLRLKRYFDYDSTPKPVQAA